MTDVPHPGFTDRQGQYLAFIYAYTLVNGRPPAESDMQRFFRVTGPAVHQMVVTLEKAGLIARQPGVPRSIAVLASRAALPPLLPAGEVNDRHHCGFDQDSTGPNRRYFDSRLGAGIRSIFGGGATGISVSHPPPSAL